MYSNSPFKKRTGEPPILQNRLMLGNWLFFFPNGRNLWRVDPITTYESWVPILQVGHIRRTPGGPAARFRAKNLQPCSKLKDEIPRLRNVILGSWVQWQWKSSRRPTENELVEFKVRGLVLMMMMIMMVMMMIIIIIIMMMMMMVAWLWMILPSKQNWVSTILCVFHIFFTGKSCENFATLIQVTAGIPIPQPGRQNCNLQRQHWVFLGLVTGISDDQGTNISPKNGILRRWFSELPVWWDMLIPWRVRRNELVIVQSLDICTFLKATNLINFGFVCIFWKSDDGFNCQTGELNISTPNWHFWVDDFPNLPFGGICYLQFPWRVLCLILGVPEMVVPNNHGFSY